MAKPFLKWVGGKRQLLVEIKKNMPTKFNNYFEPFVGGGALFFDLELESATINDYNSELINTYLNVRDNSSNLIDSLKNHKNESDYYYKIRNLDKDNNIQNLSSLERASRFIYLNKTCFNGLYRVNKKGEFNAAFGHSKNPNICDEETITAASNALKKANILCGDFQNIKNLIKKGDFIYFDPPYEPISTTSNFVSYTETGFNFEMQTKVKELCDYINSIGAYFLVSNSDSNDIKQLFKDYTIKTVQATRSINSDSTNRGFVNELLIKNY
jgi:DNA adenine methylase